MKLVDLSTPQACQVEFERCSSGLAYLDHLFTETLSAIGDAEEEWDKWESEAADAARNGDEKLTATEIKGRITSYIENNESAKEAREVLRNLRTSRAQIERWYRSLEKRGGFAQSAANIHLGGGRYGG